MKAILFWTQVLLCAAFVQGQVCTTSAICQQGGKWTATFKQVPQRSNYFPKPATTSSTGGSAQRSDPCKPADQGSSVAVGGGYRYELVSELATWKAANEVCKSRGSTLPMQAYKNNNEALTALKSVMDSRGDLNGYWVPASDKANEGQWIWENGQPLSGADGQNWQPGQPDNSGEQDCAYAARWNNYRWDDGECAGFWSAICETKV